MATSCFTLRVVSSSYTSAWDAKCSSLACLGCCSKVYGLIVAIYSRRSHKKLYNGFLIRIQSGIWWCYSILSFRTRSSDNTDECIYVQRRYDIRETTKRHKKKNASGEKVIQLRNGIKFFRHTICLVIGYRSPYSLPLSALWVYVKCMYTDSSCV